MKPFLLLLLSILVSESIGAQSFINRSDLFDAPFNSGGVTGVADVNNDGYDDLIIMHMSKELHIGYQQSDGSYQFHFLTSVSSSNQWGMCVGDIDNDGHKDVMSGGSYDGVKVVRINGPDDFVLSTPQSVQIFMQACNFADINNDGWLDGFACHDDGPSHRFRNNGSGAFVNGNDFFNYMVYPQSDMSGNYGSEWSDFDRDGDLDLMVAKCRQFVSDPYDPRRTNLLFVNDGNNNYTDQAHARGLVNLQQSWTSHFADVDNDGDFDCFITTHSGTLELYENTGGGYFNNITAQSGVGVSGFFLQGKAVDFDNDGWIDFIYAGGVSGILRNNGDNTFTALSSPFPQSPNLHSFAIGDLNKDGWPDVLCNYGTSYVTPNSNQPDRIYMNAGGSNHWIAFDLEGTISNRDAVGALVEIHGPWGIQIREVRAGESYGITNTFHMMFGIGSETAVDYAVIHWPAGGMLVIENPQIDTYHSILEADCIAPAAQIVLNGSPVLCPGDAVQLELISNTGSILWSNGGTGAVSTANSPGYYSAYAYNPATGCSAQSNVIAIEPAPSIELQISVSGDVQICEGTMAVLSSNGGSATMWSNEEVGDQIAVGESGEYSAMLETLCGTVYSNSIEISVLPAPAPVATTILADLGESVEITVSGSTINWYDAEDADEPIQTGNTFITPEITGPISFWVEEVHLYGGELSSGGKEERENSPFGQFHNSTNFWNRFDAHTDFILDSVKVYAGNGGNRTIQLVTSGNNVLQSITANIPEGESYVTLNFFVPEGTDYGLRASGNNPQLWRDRNIDLPSPFGFPYELGGIATITGTTVTGNDSDNYYYFFYDWHISTPRVNCVSERVEIEIVLTGVEEILLTEGFMVYPNPATERLTIATSSDRVGNATVTLVNPTGQVVTQTTQWFGYGSNRVTLDVSALSSGLYMIQTTLPGGEVHTKRVIIQ